MMKWWWCCYLLVNYFSRGISSIIFSFSCCIIPISLISKIYSRDQSLMLLADYYLVKMACPLSLVDNVGRSHKRKLFSLRAWHDLMCCHWLEQSAWIFLGKLLIPRSTFGIRLFSCLLFGAPTWLLSVY